MSTKGYETQVRLLVRALPEIAEDERFALKGGTAINLFVRNLPRFSIDIDLVYLPLEPRYAALAAMRDGLADIAGRLTRRRGITVERSVGAEGVRLNVRNGPTKIKVEANPVFRGTVFGTDLRPVVSAVEEQYGYAEMPVVSLADLYAGKIAAALDRQHPRDLFDIDLLLADGGVTGDIFTAFLIYLVSHKRPPHELLAPNLKDQAAAYEGEFQGMTREPMALARLYETRAALIAEVRRRARGHKAAAFLRAFYRLEPDWSLLGLTIDPAQLPAVQWKVLNLKKLATQNPRKFSLQLEALERELSQ